MVRSEIAADSNSWLYTFPVVTAVNTGLLQHTENGETRETDIRKGK